MLVTKDWGSLAFWVWYKYFIYLFAFFFFFSTSRQWKPTYSITDWPYIWLEPRLWFCTSSTKLLVLSFQCSQTKVCKNGDVSAFFLHLYLLLHFCRRIIRFSASTCSKILNNRLYSGSVLSFYLLLSLLNRCAYLRFSVNQTDSVIFFFGTFGWRKREIATTGSI